MISDMIPVAQLVAGEQVLGYLGFVVSWGSRWDLYGYTTSPTERLNLKEGMDKAPSLNSPLSRMHNQKVVLCYFFVGENKSGFMVGISKRYL